MEQSFNDICILKFCETITVHKSQGDRWIDRQTDGLAFEYGTLKMVIELDRSASRYKQSSHNQVFKTNCLLTVCYCLTALPMNYVLRLLNAIVK